MLIISLIDSNENVEDIQYLPVLNIDIVSLFVGNTSFASSI